MASNDDNVVHLKPRGKKAPAGGRGLTEKQRAFVHYVVWEERPLTEAYVHAYGRGKMSDSALSTEASRLWNNPRLSAEIERLRIEKEKAMRYDAAKIDAFVRERLFAMANDQKVPPATRLNALVKLGEIRGVGMFSKTLEVEDRTPKTREEVERRIEELVRKSSL